MDIIIIQFPNKTIELPPLGSSILVGSLRKNNYKVKQYDFNVEIKNKFIEYENLNYLYNNILPYLLKNSLLNDSYKKIVSLYEMLSRIKNTYGFLKLEKVKIMLQNREYISVFSQKEYTVIFEDLLNILTLSSSFFEIIISNSNIEKIFKKYFFFELIDTFLLEIMTLNPKVIAFSVVQMQRKISIWICNKLRKQLYYSGIIIFGGADVTYYKEKYLIVFKEIDYAIYQEGEISLKTFLEYIKGNCKISDVPNLIYRNNGEIVINRAITPYDFENNIPDFSDLNLSRYLTNALPMQISRGCSWGNCTYCKHFRTYGEKYYEGNIKKAIDNIIFLKERYNTNLFHFVDDDFPRELKNKFSLLLIANKVDIYWLTYSRLDSNISYDNLRLWYEAGLRVIEWGLESASQAVLNSVKKGICIENIIKLLFDAKRANLLSKLFMFHNLPRESYEDLYISIQFLKKFVKFGIVRAFWEISTPLELLEGTPLYDEAINSPIFEKVFKPRGILDSKATYIHQCNYKIKEDIFNAELEKEEQYYKKKGILNVNDEAIMFDIIVNELSNKFDIYAKVR